MTSFQSETALDVIVRFHDIERLSELQQAVLALVAQQYRPLRILLVLQRFTDEHAAKVQASLAPLLSLPGAPTLECLRFNAPDPPDARSALVNMGFGSTTGRYVALLDYDDVIYPEAYRLLVTRLREFGAAIAFAGIIVRRVDVYPGFVQVHGTPQPFHGKGLKDLLRQNFCPIHSFVIDRSKVDPRDLRFEENLSLEEDYDFLLRLCARYKSDFGLLDTIIGEYYFKTDESNTLAGRLNIPPQMRSRAHRAQSFIFGRKDLLYLSQIVQEDLGIESYEPGLTVAEYLERVPR